ncbi:DNA-processing protein DprA [Niallia taxi]|uniref:DNA-processing protein DprA n=1 Tax=Niallia taxi TaxID=2499688 RepID=UPI00255022B7|nr:DNA-processing protein DprA [Niallia taxi]MDK8643794.1 DNA-processing protein DprA [Niallia taxi]
MNRSNTKSILLLLKQFGFSDKTLSKIYENEDDILEVIFDKKHPFYNKYYEIYTDKERGISEDYEKLVEFSQSFLIKMKEYKNKGIKILCRYSDDYPHHLFNGSNKPLFLYCFGNLELLNGSTNKVAIIGTRNPTMQGRDKTKKYVRKYVLENWITISGLAKGIDTIVHEETIFNKGKTIAVIPTSFEKIYPVENTNLFRLIIQNGGLGISIIGPFEITYKSTFLERNTIVANLCNEMFVIEASIKSGTLNTVRKGYEIDKKIYYDSSLIDVDVRSYLDRFNAIDVVNGEER